MELPLNKGKKRAAHDILLRRQIRKREIYMNEKSISFCQGKGSLTHNNRTFVAKHIDNERIKENIIFKQQPVKDAYDYLFQEAVIRHNRQQKIKSRHITDYYQHLFKHDYSDNVIQSSNKEKSFYEDLMQIGTMKDTACGTADSETAKECLIEYMNGFQERNPNFYVFNAVLHMDEATPHLHFDYIPFAHYNAKLDTRNSISKALEEMGFGKDKNAIARWREREYQVMKQICEEHGIEVKKPEKARGTYAKEVFIELDNAKQEIEKLKAENTKLKTMIDENETILKETSEQVTKITNIDSIEVGRTMFGSKVTVPKEEYENVSKLAKKQIADIKTEKKAVKENKQLKEELAEKDNQINTLKTELEKYKPSEPRYFSREAIKEEARSSSLIQRLKDKINDLMLFIEIMALTSEFYEFMTDRISFIRKHRPEKLHEKPQTHEANR